MADDDSGDKTEEPTQKKLDDARKRGQVWKSQDFTSVAVFLTGMGVIKGTWDHIEGELFRLFGYAIDKVSHPEMLQQSTKGILYMAGTTMFVAVVPVLLACAAVALLVEFVQVGALISTEVIMPKLEKLNPLQGLKNLFSKKQLVESLKSGLKMAIAGYVVYGVGKDSIRMLTMTVRGDAQTTMLAMGDLMFLVCVRVGLLYIVFAMFDLWFQRRSFMKEMMMSKEEIKREYKDSEGDPHHKAKRKELHQEILEGAQMESVKKSDVVVTNPDHVAVALRYERGQGAPVVLLKGTDAVAEAIKRAARQENVNILRNVPLARALLAVEPGHEVPLELYDAVAEVLNFVYALQQPRSSSARWE